MDSNQNGMYDNNQPNQQNQAYGQSNPYDQPNQQNPYGQPNQQNPYGQPNQQNPYSQPNQQNPYSQPNQQNPYGQPNQPYGQPPYMNNSYMQVPYGEVKDIFCNILLVIMPLRIILSLIMNIATFSAMSDYSSLMNGSYLTALGGAYTAISVFSNLLFIAYIVFIILDIVGVSKAKYKVTGLVLFAIFLNAGYYIWRAYILGRKKTVPIIYTVVYSVLLVVNMIITFYYSFNMSYSIMNSIM